MKPALTASIIIATRNRPAPLAETLESIQQQSTLPAEVIVVDSSDDGQTKTLCEGFTSRAKLPIRYMSVTIRSAAIQRNMGAQNACGEVLVFLDDDVLLERSFLAELLRPLSDDLGGKIGGLGGTIWNELPSPPSRLNRTLLRMFLGVQPHKCAGRLVGPGVQFPYADIGPTNAPVDWLPSGACAYRKSVFQMYRFAETFQGYSFMEDVELSARIGRQYELMQVGKARLYHKGLGGSTHTDWIAHGESRIVNRHHVMTHVMGKTGAGDLTRLLAYEIVYSTLAGLWNAGRGGAVRKTLLQLVGRVRGAIKIVCGKSPHSVQSAAARTEAR